MDKFIKTFPAIADGDLMLCPENGVAWQTDMAHRVPYDAPYFDKYVGYEGTEIARAINAGRVDLVNRHVGPAGGVLDIGIGSGEFIKRRMNTFGFDVNPKAIEWLHWKNRWSDKFYLFQGFTFWDVLEHIEAPEHYFDRMFDRPFVFLSAPIFPDLTAIRASKHYRPGEHLYYFTEDGLVRWMALHGFLLRERDDFETRAGRDSILSFAFLRD